MFSNFKTTFKALALIASAIAFIFVIGCSSDSSTGPDEGPKFETPKTMIITKIVATSFPSKKSNGDNWDWDPFFSGPRKPDIYAKLGEKNASGEFASITRDDASSGTKYDLSKKRSSSKKSLPYELNYKDAYSIVLVDDDGIFGSETMGSKTIYPSDYYGNDNATNFTKTISCSNGVKMQVSGVWTY